MERNGESEDQGFLPPEPAGPEPELGDRPRSRRRRRRPRRSSPSSRRRRHTATRRRHPATAIRHRRLRPATGTSSHHRPRRARPIRRRPATPIRRRGMGVSPAVGAGQRPGRGRLRVLTGSRQPADHLRRLLDDHLDRLRDRRDHLLAKGQAKGRRRRDPEAPRAGAGGLHHRLGQPGPVDPGDHRVGARARVRDRRRRLRLGQRPEHRPSDARRSASLRDSSGADAILGRPCRTPTSSSI